MEKIVIIIPTFNEAQNTPIMIEKLSGVISQIKKYRIEVLYVDDSSPDGTAEIVLKESKKHPWLNIIINPQKAGLGQAYSVGMQHAIKNMKADWLMELDADLQHPPELIPELVSQIEKGYDYIIASRYISGGGIPKNWGFDRKFLSIVGNITARILLFLPHIHDVTGGFKLSRVKGFMEEFNFKTLLSKVFAYKIHLLFYMTQKGAKVKEVPLVYLERKSGESKITRNEMRETLRVIFLLQLKNPKIRQFVKFGIVGLIGFIVNSLTLELFSNSPLPDALGKSLFFLDPYPVLTLFAHAPAWAAALSAETAIISNFTLNNFWTFSNQRAKSPLRILRKFIKFNLTSFGAVAIQFAVIGTSTQFLGDTTIIRQLSLVAAIVLFIVPYNWVMYNKVIWKKH